VLNLTTISKKIYLFINMNQNKPANLCQDDQHGINICESILWLKINFIKILQLHYPTLFFPRAKLNFFS
jgi:hypothetical protein